MHLCHRSHEDHCYCSHRNVSLSSTWQSFDGQNFRLWKHSKKLFRYPEALLNCNHPFHTHCCDIILRFFCPHSTRKKIAWVVAEQRLFAERKKEIYLCTFFFSQENSERKEKKTFPTQIPCICCYNKPNWIVYVCDHQKKGHKAVFVFFVLFLNQRIYGRYYYHNIETKRPKRKLLRLLLMLR